MRTIYLNHDKTFGRCRDATAFSNPDGLALPAVMVGIICALAVIGLTELPNSRGAKAHPADPLVAALILVISVNFSELCKNCQKISEH